MRSSKCSQCHNAPGFCPICFARVDLFSTIQVGQRKNSVGNRDLLFCGGTKMCWFFFFVDANQNGSLRKEKLNLGGCMQLIKK